jgi:hypothetical protein
MSDRLYTLSDEEAAAARLAVRWYRKRSEDQVRRLRERFGEHAEIARQEMRVELLDAADRRLNAPKGTP